MTTYRVQLAIRDIAGGFPGSVDQLRAYLQLPQLAARVPAHVRDQFLKEEAQFSSDTPGGDDASGYLRTGFRLLNGEPCLAQHQIKAMLQQAVITAHEPSRTAADSRSKMAEAVRFGLQVRPRAIPLQVAGEITTAKIEQIVKHPRMGFPVPVNRERQILTDASCELYLDVLDVGIGSRLTEERLHRLLEVGGRFVGLGTDRGYDYGRFEVVMFERES